MEELSCLEGVFVTLRKYFLFLLCTALAAVWTVLVRPSNARSLIVPPTLHEVVHEEVARFRRRGGAIAHFDCGSSSLSRANAITLRLLLRRERGGAIKAVLLDLRQRVHRH